MLKLTKEQCSKVNKMEDNDFVQDTAQKLKNKYLWINEPDNIFLVRLRNALNYANTLPLKDMNVRRDFLRLELFYPGFYQKPEVDKWLRVPNGYSADQRLEDYKHVMLNRERRKLRW